MRPHLSFPRFAPRDSQAAVRGVTPLELLFDLAAVVAIGAAAGYLSEAFVAGKTGAALLGFLCSFFMIWWAWMNYTWFASAYDDGSAAFRILTMALTFGALMVRADGDESAAAPLIGLSAAAFIATLWMIRDVLCLQGRARLILPISSALLIAASWVPVLALELTAAILVLTAIARRRLSQQHATG